MLEYSSRMQRSLAYLRLVAVGGASVGLGCSGPTCDDPVETTLTFPATKAADGRLSPSDRTNGGLTYATCKELCEDAPQILKVDGCDLVALDAETRVDVHCLGTWASCHNHYTLGSGRRPAGFVPAGLGDHLAEMARLEGAAAAAFEQLARELEFHRAPAPLVNASRRAAGDELRHEHLLSALARRHGAQPSKYERPGMPRRFVRSLHDVAIENAREGVVNESFGALLNAAQAEAAPDDTVRGIFADLWLDEVFHAAISLHVHRWALTRLPRAMRVRVCQEVRRAHGDLARGCAPDPVRGRLLGHPERAVQLGMLAMLRREVLSACA